VYKNNLLTLNTLWKQQRKGIGIVEFNNSLDTL